MPLANLKIYIIISSSGTIVLWTGKTCVLQCRTYGVRKKNGLTQMLYAGNRMISKGEER